MSNAEKLHNLLQEVTFVLLSGDLSEEEINKEKNKLLKLFGYKGKARKTWVISLKKGEAIKISADWCEVTHSGALEFSNNLTTEEEIYGSDLVYAIKARL